MTIFASRNRSAAAVWALLHEGTVVSLSARLVAQVGGLVSLLWAARVLTPAEVGSYLMVTTTVVVIQKILEAGYGEIIFSPERSTPSEVRAGFGVLLGLGAFVAITLALLVGIAWQIGWIAAPTVLAAWLLTATMPTGCVAHACANALLRDGKPLPVAGAQLLSELAGLATAIALLYAGWGVLALAVSRVAAVTSAAVVMAHSARLAPSLRGARGFLRKHGALLGSFAAARSAEMFRTYGIDYVILGALGVGQVALYRIANRIVGAFAEVITEPLRLHVWARSSRLIGSCPSDATHDGARLLNASLSVIVPVFVLLAVHAEGLVALLMPGAQWQDTAAVIALLALGRLVLPLGLYAELVWVVRGSGGQVATMGVSMAVFNLVVVLAAVWISASAVAAAAGMSVAAVSFLAYSIYRQRQLVAWPVRDVLMSLAQTLALAVVSAGSAHAVLGWVEVRWTVHPAFVLGTSTLMGLVSYGVLMLLLFRKRLDYFGSHAR